MSLVEQEEETIEQTKVKTAKQRTDMQPPKIAGEYNEALRKPHHNSLTQK
jgi:hypothetical protein